MARSNLNVNTKKFVYYAPLVKLKKDAMFRPYIEIPLEMKNQGYESYLICGKLCFSPPNEINVVETGMVSERRFDILRVYKFTELFLRKNKPDIFIFFHMNLIILPIIIYSKMHRLNTKFLVKLDSDGSDFENKYHIIPFLKRLYVILISYFLKGIIIENSCGLDKLKAIKLININKLFLLPNAFSQRAYSIKKYQDSKRESYVLFVGRIHPEKNVSLLIDAFLNATESLKMWQIHLVGSVDDEDYFNKLTNEYEESISSGRVLFKGPLYDDALKSEYYHAAIFCLPSINESYGLVRMEAIANGVPVITSEAGCGKDFEKYGSLVFYHSDYIRLEHYIRILIDSESKRIEISNKQSEHIVTYPYIIQKLLNFCEVM